MAEIQKRCYRCNRIVGDGDFRTSHVSLEVGDNNPSFFLCDLCTDALNRFVNGLLLEGEGEFRKFALRGEEDQLEVDDG